MLHSEGNGKKQDFRKKALKMQHYAKYHAQKKGIRITLNSPIFSGGPTGT
jgi:hypothetical protein